MRSKLGWLTVALLVVITAGAALAVRSQFTDVTDQHPVDAIEWAADQGITLGCDVGKFCPDEPLTRKHARVFMERFYDNVLGAAGDDQYSHPDFTRADMMELLHTINAGGQLATPQGLVTSTDCAFPDGLGSARLDWQAVTDATGYEARFGDDSRTATAVLRGYLHHTFVLDTGDFVLSVRATNSNGVSDWSSALVTVEECDYVETTDTTTYTHHES